MFIVLLLAAYLCGSIPWSVWLGKAFYGTDPRQQADGNPGAANAFRAGGAKLGIAVLVLDFLKAFLPVLVAYRGMGLANWESFLVALMPTLGHAFSIFLGFRGGRAIVVMFGVWTALTLYLVPVFMGITALAAVRLVRNDVWRTLIIPVVLVPFLVLLGEPLWMVTLAAAQLLVFVVKIAAPRFLPGAAGETA
ncbi:MAG: glycerol-3-phosphate acyltransferase [Anaerolineae bacterium]|nr:glycerol-3-phosphate acyltransferase [Anaerolineae bacterium]